MSGIDPFLADELARVQTLGAYASGTAAGVQIDKLLALVEPQHTTVQRGYLDQMSPACQIQLIKELRALKAVITAYEAP
jgi:type IV secretory pathway protease TraF